MEGAGRAFQAAEADARLWMLDGRYQDVHEKPTHPCPKLLRGEGMWQKKNGLFTKGFRRPTMKHLQEAQYDRGDFAKMFSDLRFPLCVPCQRVCVLPRTSQGRADHVRMHQLVELLLAGSAEAVEEFFPRGDDGVFSYDAFRRLHQEYNVVYIDNDTAHDVDSEYMIHGESEAHYFVMTEYLHANYGDLGGAQENWDAEGRRQRTENSEFVS